jgi:hypothetical protein
MSRIVVLYTYFIVFFFLSLFCVWWCPTHIVLCFLFCPRYVYGGSYTYCIVFFVLSSLCVWWCHIHIVLCFLLCPRYVYGGVLYILYYVFCFVLVISMVVSYTYCIVFFVLTSLCVWWCPIHIVLCKNKIQYVYDTTIHITRTKQKTQYNMHRTTPFI